MSGCLASLAASAETFDVLGLEPSARECRLMAKAYSEVAEVMGDGFAYGVFRDGTTQMAVRAVEKLQEYGERI